MSDGSAYIFITNPAKNQLFKFPITRTRPVYDPTEMINFGPDIQIMEMTGRAAPIFNSMAGYYRDTTGARQWLYRCVGHKIDAFEVYLVSNTLPANPAAGVCV